MAFTIVDRQPGGHSGKISTGDAGEAVEIWTVVADDTEYSTEDLRLSGIFPPVYDSFHAKNGRLRLQPIDIQQDADNPSLFVCTLTWNSDQLEPQEDEKNPLNRRARITVKTQFDKVTKHRDFYGKPKVNAAGDLFDPPIESNETHLVITIRKNVTVFPDWVFEFADTVNSQPFVIEGRTIDTGCAWIASIDLGEKQFEQGYPVYCEALIEIHVKRRRKPRSYQNCSVGEAPDYTVTCRTVEEDPVDVPYPWDTEQLNEGLIEVVPQVEYFDDNGNAILLTDADGNPLYKRQRIKILDEDGLTLVYAPAPVPLTPAGRRKDNITIDNANYLVFRDHEYLDFNQIAYLWNHT